VNGMALALALFQSSDERMAIYGFSCVGFWGAAFIVD
jgi:hypothetical protein